MDYKYKLSIIIPVYNVQGTLRKCVESTIQQNIISSDYEILLINDGSTDNSLEIAKELETKYENVSVISQENQGLGAARNTGMRLSSAEYLTFLDSDDSFVPGKLNEVLEICKVYDLDVCRFKKIFIRADGSEIMRDKFKKAIYNHIYSGKEAFNLFVGSACASLFRSSLIKNNKLEFYKGITQEDVEFTTRLFTKVKRAMCCDIILYRCLFNYQSLSRDKSYEKQNRYICDTIKVASLNMEYAESLSNKDVFKTLIKRRVNSAIAGMMLNFIRFEEVPKEIVANFVDCANNQGVLPLRGLSNSFATTLFIPIANNENIYYLLYNIVKKVKKSIKCLESVILKKL